MVTITHKERPCSSKLLVDIPTGTFFTGTTKIGEKPVLYVCIASPLSDTQKIAYQLEDAVITGSDCFYGNTWRFYDYRPKNVEIICTPVEGD